MTVVQTTPQEPGTAGTRPLLRVRGLTIVYDGPRGPATAVDRLDLDVAPGEVLGLAGESGCGKSTLAQALMRLIAPPGFVVEGSVDFDGRDVLALDPDELRRFRWQEVSIVMQSAMNALNPVTTVRMQMRDTYRAHVRLSRAEADERAVDLLRLVGLPADRLDQYPHELSGGMRQRVVIALALALEPRLVIMDEPTTALDVVLQREIVDEIRRLRAQFGFSVLFITHDLALLSQISDRVAVMYAGRIVEEAPTGALVDDPKHPYTRLLLDSLPRVSGSRALSSIQGSPPDLVEPPAGCRFHPRCPLAFEPCPSLDPALVAVEPGRRVACHLRPAP